MIMGRLAGGAQTIALCIATGKACLNSLESERNTNSCSSLTGQRGPEQCPLDLETLINKEQCENNGVIVFPNTPKILQILSLNFPGYTRLIQ